MPRGDQPTTTALALKDGWIYEDALPVAITKEQYDWWFKESLVLDGVRMGPPLPEPPDRIWMRAEVLASPELREHFVKLNSNDIEYSRVPAPIVAPTVDAMWEALKAACCKNPAEAKLAVFVSEKKFKEALAPFAAPIAPVVDNLQHRLYEECVTANWDPERKNTFAEEIAHLHEELSEAFRAWRRYKDCEVREVNGKLEGVPIEFADALIGMFYNAELYGFDLLAAVERKHQFNLNRNYVAEGRQLHAPAPASTVAPQQSALRDEATCKCGLDKDDPIHSFSTEWQQMHTFMPRTATTPPSTLARKAAEEIGKYLDAFTPLSPGAEMIRIFERAIIERCFSAEGDKRSALTAANPSC